MSGIKLKVVPQFPAQVIGGAGINLTKANGIFTLDLDYTDFPQVTSVPPGVQYALIFDPVAKQYVQVPTTAFGGGGGLPDAPNDGNFYARKSAAWALFFPREKLQADRTYFVNPATGNDANTGLSSGAAFATNQKALDTCTTLDLNTHNVTIQCAAGNYAPSILTTPWIGKGTVTVNGDTVTPSNCTFAGAGAECFNVSNYGARLSIQGFKLTTTAGAGAIAQNGGQIIISDKCEFGACQFTWLAAVNGGGMTLGAASHIMSGAGGNAAFWCQGGGSTFNVSGNTTWTLAANITVSTAFFYCSTAAEASVPNMTFTLGAFTVTGKRFNVDNIALLQTFSGNVNYFPGTIAGTGTNPSVAPWGLYA